MLSQGRATIPPAQKASRRIPAIPPGQYLKWYNIYYAANTIRDSNHDAGAGLDLDVFATVRIHLDDRQKVLGADYGMDIAVPFLNVDVKVAAAGISDSTHSDRGHPRRACRSGLARRPLGSRRGGLGGRLGAPPDDSACRTPPIPARDSQTGMFTLGSTYYFGEERA